MGNNGEKPVKDKVILIGKGYGWWFAPKETPEDTEVWGINDLILKRVDVDMMFNMHLLEEYSEVDMQCANMCGQLDIPVIMPRKYEHIPSSVAFPLDEVVKEFETDYFMTGIAYMIAYAVYKGYKQIDCYGINMRGIDEKYKNARACVEYWLGVAKGRGVKVFMHGRYTDCLKTFDRRLYGYSDMFQWMPEDITDKALYLAFGLSLDRTSLKKLHNFLSLQKNAKYRLNFAPLPINENNPGRLYAAIERMTIFTDEKNHWKFAGDCGMYYLHHVDTIMGTEHTARLVCLEGDRDRTINDWMDFSGEYNYWTDPQSAHFGKDDKQSPDAGYFPKYDLPKEKAIARFYDEYYKIAKRCVYKYPGFFKIYPESILDTEEGQRELLKFLGYKDEEMTLGEVESGRESVTQGAETSAQ